MFEVDEIKIYRGHDVKITDKIIVTQPTIDEIINFGEQRYWNAIHNLTSVGADMKWQLMDWFGIDYTTIDDYDLFLKLICPLVSSKKKMFAIWKLEPEKYKKELDEYNDLDDDEKNAFFVNPLELVLKDIDLADFYYYKSNVDDETFLYNPKKDITIDRLKYEQIIEVVRKIHGFKRNNQIPANERTKMDLIDDARDEAMAASRKPFKSVLLPLLSALSVKTGQCGDDKIYGMKINMFFDNIKRVSKIQDSQLLLQGAYSGFASLKGVDKTRLDWAGDI